MSDEKGLPMPRLGKSEKPSGVNHLLIIAIDRYKYCEPLHNCVSDAQQLIRTLTQRFPFNIEKLETLFNEEANRANIYKKLEDLQKKVDKEDSLVIYFSGHGDIRKDQNGNPQTGFWIPVDARPGQRYDYISSVELVDLLNAINCFHLFVIVDACFAGSLFRNYRGDGDIGDDNRKSRLGLASAHSREKAFDGQPGEGSPFSKILLSELENAKGSIGAERLSINVKEKLMREEIGQKPVFRTLDVRGDDAGQFIFYPRGENTFLDPRDYRLYRTVEINGLTWMAENLDYDVGEGCWHYLNDPNIGKSFGRLYTWDAAKKACPPGWRLPTEEEWMTMINSLGGHMWAYGALVAGGSSSFSALLGGDRYPDGGFHYLGRFGFYWSGTENDSDEAWCFTFLGEDNDLAQVKNNKSWGFSCRCVQNTSPKA